MQKNNLSSRRHFLKQSLKLAAAPLILNFPLFGKDAPSNRLNLALIGCGNMGVSGDLKNALACGANILAVCDVDEAMMSKAIKSGGDKMLTTARYTDYRELLEKENSLDGVIIATPDHWHAAICSYYLKANKHVYCEKPLTRTIAEARRLRKLVATSRSVTQMGNQGSANPALRRSIEVIQAGALGTVTHTHVVSPGERYPTGVNRPAGEDPIPQEFNWDFWVGPSPIRPYKTDIYHPYKWRGWLDFGTGQIGNWATHSLNIVIRALELGMPDRIEINGTGLGKEAYWTGGTITYQFNTCNTGKPFSIYWHENIPTPDAFKGLPKNDEGTAGVVIVGDKGTLYTNPHNGHVLIKLNGEQIWKDILWHQPTHTIAATLPRVKSHMQEWLDGCQGGPKPYSSFDIATRMTETCLLGLLGTQLGSSFDYDPVAGKPKSLSADHLIDPVQRTNWIS